MKTTIDNKENNGNHDTYTVSLTGYPANICSTDDEDKINNNKNYKTIQQKIQLKNKQQQKRRKNINNKKEQKQQNQQKTMY